METQALSAPGSARGRWELAESRGAFSHRLGRAGEARAEAWLCRRGMRILERRYRCRSGEIDLIAEAGPCLVFVEVKARRRRSQVAPAESVNGLKRRRIAQTALAFLTERGWSDRPCRFDVVEVFTGAYGEFSGLRHIEDAFRIPAPGRNPQRGG